MNPRSEPGPRSPQRQSLGLVLCLRPKQKRRSLTRYRRWPCCCRGTRTPLLRDDSFCQAVYVGLVAALDAAALQCVFKDTPIIPLMSSSGNALSSDYPCYIQLITEGGHW